MDIWLENDLDRILPRDHQRDKPLFLHLRAFRGQRIYFQIGISDSDYVAGKLKLYPVSSDFPVTENLQFFWQELVPLRYQTTQTPPDWLETVAPGFVPDVLLPIQPSADYAIKLSAGEMRGVWCDLQIPRDLAPGHYGITVIPFFEGNMRAELRITLEIFDMILEKDTFPVTNWLDFDGLAAYYRLTGDVPEPPCLDIIGAYVRCLAEHGQTMAWFPGFKTVDKLEKQQFSHVSVSVTNNGYEFDFEHLRKLVELYRQCGILYFEMPFLTAGLGRAHHVLGNIKGELRPLWPENTAIFSAEHLRFISAYIPALVQQLKALNIFQETKFHIADEPPLSKLPDYLKFRELLRSLEPDIQVMDALYNYRFAESRAVDLPVTQLYDIPTFEKYGAVSWAYICNYPRGTYPNRFLDYALHRQRVLGFVMARYNIKGFLHWGANFWWNVAPNGKTDGLANPYYVNDSQHWPEWYAGDPFVLYPGDQSPVVSLRLKVFKAALEDRKIMMALLQRKECRPEVERQLREVGSLDKMSNRSAGLGKAIQSLFECGKMAKA